MSDEPAFPHAGPTGHQRFHGEVKRRRSAIADAIPPPAKDTEFPVARLDLWAFLHLAAEAMCADRNCPSLPMGVIARMVDRMCEAADGVWHETSVNTRRAISEAIDGIARTDYGRLEQIAKDVGAVAETPMVDIFDEKTGGWHKRPV